MSKEKKPKKPKSLKKVVTIVVIAMTVIFLLFPREYYFLDGGSKMYCSLFGFIYRVEQLHKIYDEAGYSYYEIGTVVTVFGIEVFNNAHVDYEHGHPLQHSPEVEAVNKEIDKILN